ncbi:MAG TPA: TetR/AcrR family transcriptional regulator [Syntrophomonadaceae bacterium]|nr:TetR/AcrR family transcriptional regulator [Syntrophomonadaceae bacterium]HRX20498.1 TetR/AcrR family transcriptional regulator [Syntrophomonadaceae bacterium]
MENKNTDRRIIRTKQVIREALVGLIEEKGFDSLTVKDITERANINRGTFYLHYRDKFDLLEQTVSEIAEECKNIVLQSNELNLIDYRKSDEPVPVMVSLFEYFNENASLIRALLGIKGDLSFQTQFKKVLWSNIFEKELSVHIKKENLLVPSEYLITYLISAHLGVVQQWLDKDVRESPRQMASILYLLSFYGPFYAAGVNIMEN